MYNDIDLNSSFVSVTFEQACALVSEGCFEASDAEKLELYGHFKLANSEVPATGTTLVSKAKYEAYARAVEKCRNDSELAKQEYTSLVVRLVNRSLS